MTPFSRLFDGLGIVAPDEKDWGENPITKLVERRSSLRYVISPNEAFVGWWVGEDFHSVAAYFHDVCSTGALVCTREVPPRERIWVALARPGDTRWCRARIVRTKETATGLVQVGLGFDVSSEAALFQGILQGN
jgi:hypothetical protein